MLQSLLDQPVLGPGCGIESGMSCSHTSYESNGMDNCVSQEGGPPWDYIPDYTILSIPIRCTRQERNTLSLFLFLSLCSTYRLVSLCMARSRDSCQILELGKYSLLAIFGKSDSLCPRLRSSFETSEGLYKPENLLAYFK